MWLLRNTGRRTDIDSVSSILRWLQAPPQDADPIEVQTCCLLLLGQWVTGELYRPLSKAANIHICAHAYLTTAAGQFQTQKHVSWRRVLCCHGTISSVGCFILRCHAAPTEQPSGESLVDLISQSADAALGVAAAISEQTSPKLAAATVYALGCASPGNLAVLSQMQPF